MKNDRNKKGQFIKGKRNVSWNGGRVLTPDGYVKIYAPDHPFNNGHYVLEHRLVMEIVLGRYLAKEEIVHHINHDRSDNRPENLLVMKRGSHTTLHSTSRIVNEATRKKISDSLLGHSFSSESLKKMSVSHKNNPARYWLGKKSVMEQDDKGRFIRRKK